MKNLITLSLITAAILGVNGCGGGGSSSSSSSTAHNSVADGYIENAFVCHDSNQNMQCTDEAIYATTDVNGQYNLSNYDNTLPLLVQIPVGAIDHGPFANGTTGTRTFSNEVFYFYPAGTSASSVYVSPFSTLVYALMNAMPGMSLEDAQTYIRTQLGLPSNFDLLDNHITQNATGTAGPAQLIAEMINTALANETANSNAEDAMLLILANLNNIGNTASSADATTYDTTSYTLPNTAVNLASNLTFTPVNDICTDLASGTADYFSFESWDTASKEHKTLYTKVDPNDGKTYLQLRVENSIGNSWAIDTFHTTTESSYLNKIERMAIDMTNVNSTSQSYTKVRNDLPFPAELISCNGNSATFENAGIQFKLFASQSDISGVNGANLPQGPTVGSILNNVAFQTGDLMYRLSVRTGLGGAAYSVEKGVSFDSSGTAYPSQPRSYVVFREGTMNSSSLFLSMSSSDDINTLVTNVNSSFVIRFQDSANYILLDLTSPLSSNNTGTLNVVTVDSGSITTTVPMVYSVETNNGTPFLLVKDYYGSNRDLFIGKVDALDSSRMIFGQKESGSGLFFLTQGGIMDGDIMDDIMLNTSARDRVLFSKGLSSPILP